MTTATTIPATAKHTATLIFAHGSPRDASPTNRTQASAIQEVDGLSSPNGSADKRCVSMSNSSSPMRQYSRSPSTEGKLKGFGRGLIGIRMTMPSWFDVYELGSASPSRRTDDDGIRQSAGRLQKLISEEVENGIDPSRIVVGGFSQGECVHWPILI